MTDTNTSFQVVLDALQDESKSFPSRYFKFFSDLDPASLRSLAEIWSRVSLPRKLTLLKDLESLAENDTLVSFEDLARALLADQDGSVRAAAIRLLFESEDAKLAPIFINILKRDEDVFARAEAATALGMFVMLGELEEIPEATYHKVEDALLEAENGKDQPEVRRRALESLGYSSRLEVQTLLESAYHREDPEWVASALFAMGRSSDERWSDNVVAMLLSDDALVRMAAVEAAGELRLTDARKILLQMLEDGEEEDDVIEAAIWSLSNIGGEDVRTYLESLVALAEDDDMIEYLEEALENLSFTEDMERFELLAFGAEDELDELDELDLELDELENEDEE
jgi:HEAT repeat protein